MMQVGSTEHDLISTDLDHDAIAAAQSKELLSAGFMEEEFACYGTAFIEDKKIKYYISTTERSMNRFITRCIMRNVYPTPPKYYVMRCNVSAGLKNDIRQQFKLETAYALKADYSPTYFKAMEELSAYPTDNEAMPILMKMSCEIENTFDKVALEMFRGLVIEAVIMKHLTREGYSYWQNWLENEYRKMEDDIHEYNYYKRTYSGFSYLQNGKIHFIKNAFETKTIERRTALIAEGKMVTPIFKKDYFAATYGELDFARDAFTGLMQAYFNEGYFHYLQQLHDLPSVVPYEHYHHWEERVEECGTKKEKNSLQYHGYLWNVKQR